MKGGKQQVFKGPPTFDPIVTKVLIGCNLLALIAATAVSGSFARIGSQTLIDYGLFGGRDFGVGVAQGEWYRFITSGFLHDGMLHIGFNMYALWILGPQLERVLDRWRFLALYFTSMLGGGFGVMLLDPDAFTVGASGAVFGLFGAVAVIQRASGGSIWASGIGQVLAINLLLTFAIPRISVGGHLGGLVAGAIVGTVYIAAVRSKQNRWVGLGLVVALGIALAAAAVAIASNPVF